MTSSSIVIVVLFVQVSVRLKESPLMLFLRGDLSRSSDCFKHFSFFFWTVERVNWSVVAKHSAIKRQILMKSIPLCLLLAEMQCVLPAIRRHGLFMKDICICHYSSCVLTGPKWENNNDNNNEKKNIYILKKPKKKQNNNKQNKTNLRTRDVEYIVCGRNDILLTSRKIRPFFLFFVCFSIFCINHFNWARDDMVQRSSDDCFFLFVFVDLLISSSLPVDCCWFGGYHGSGWLVYLWPLVASCCCYPTQFSEWSSHAATCRQRQHRSRLNSVSTNTVTRSFSGNYCRQPMRWRVC